MSVTDEITSDVFANMIIPKLIHQIWIQEEDLPDKYKPCQESWMKYEERGWKYKLWHGKEIRDLLFHNFPFLVSCYDNARSHSSRSNFARYIILYLYGGVYVDTDMKSIRDIDILLHDYEFIVCRETKYQLATCIIASNAGHIILEYCLNYYRNRYYDPYQMSYLASGPVFFSKRFGEYIRRYSQKNIAVYDTRVFLPISFHQRVDMDPDLSDPSLHGAYTVHYWDYSWKRSVFAVSGYNLAVIILLIIITLLIITYAIYYSIRCKRRYKMVI